MKNSYYRKINKAVCVGGQAEAKNAALFFDEVVPLTFSPCPVEIRSPELDHGVHNYICSRGLEFNYNIGTWTFSLLENSPEMKRLFPPELPDYELDALFARYYFDNSNEFRTKLTESIVTITGEKAAIIAPPNDIQRETLSSTSEMLVALSNLPIVNTYKADWSQIIEFRHDKSSVSQLRRLRLFLFENYNGKSIDYAQDHFLKCVDDYESASRKHGFELYHGTLSTLLTSKSVLATSGGVLASVLLGSPLAAAASLSIGTAVEVGKIALSVARSKYQIQEFSNDHPLAYVLNVRKELKNGPKRDEEMKGSSI